MKKIEMHCKTKYSVDKDSTIDIEAVLWNAKENKEKGIINFTLKTDRDHSNVVYCNAPESLASFIVKDSHIFIEGDFDLSDPSRVIIDVKKISYTQDF